MFEFQAEVQMTYCSLGLSMAEAFSDKSENLQQDSPDQETSQAAADAADAMDATDADLPFLRDQEVQTDFADKKDVPW